MWINRIAAALALLSAAVHISAGANLLIAAMALLCILCAFDLLRSPGNRAWVMVAATSAGMLLGHASFPSHHHTASQPTSMTAASALAALELVLAVTVVFFRTRHIPPELHPYRLQELR